MLRYLNYGNACIIHIQAAFDIGALTEEQYNEAVAKLGGGDPCDQTTPLD